MDHESLMREALRLAEIAAGADEVPVGAVIVKDGLLLGQGYNQNITARDPTAHAEIMALREGCDYYDNYRLTGSTLYVTLEPCLMCFTALVHARVQTLVYGAPDLKAGFSLFLDEAARAGLNHQLEIISGVLEAECVETIQAFFREKRQRGKRKWMREK
ncbi:MAG: tRNA adenosine(34) deaminase TadA [Acidobacteriota bacterium]|nr:tRNA adenosine(34) deaminase TadA [Acidobacteriota bacterium]